MAASKRQELANVLHQIEQILAKSIPATVRQLNFQEPVYCLFICYDDGSSEPHTPYLQLVPARLRPQLVQSNVQWLTQEIENVERIRRHSCQGPDLDALCDQAYQLMFDIVEEASSPFAGLEGINFPIVAPPPADDQELLEPIRSMLHGLAQYFNKHDWQRVVPVTDDFVVVAVDSIGMFVGEDLAASIPPPRLKLLKNRGLL